MIRNFNFDLGPVCWAVGLFGLILGACSDDTTARGGGGGVAGVDAAGRANDAGAAGNDQAAGDNAGASGGAPDPSHAGGAIEPGPSGTAGNTHSGESGEGSGGGSGGGGAATSAGAFGVEPSGGNAGAGSAGSGGQAVSLMVPCDVYAAHRVCRDCHGSPPNGAPMPLVTLVDLQLFADSSFRAIFTGTMPAEGALTRDESRLILDWLEAGAKGVPQADCR